MARKCIHHPGRSATLHVGGKDYCAKCQAAQLAAARLVDRHVEPKDCFIWYLGGDRWVRITGTGCAHWVAHQNNTTQGSAIHRCLKGKTIKVSDIARGKHEIKDLAKVMVNDVYVTPKKDHCGLVSRVTLVPNSTPKIEIQHDSSRQGKVAKNDFATYFHGKGSFFR